jgi:hypothetical protein
MVQIHSGGIVNPISLISVPVQFSVTKFVRTTGGTFDVVYSTNHNPGWEPLTWCHNRRVLEAFLDGRTDNFCRGGVGLAIATYILM